MADRAVAVVEANVLLNLATPVADSRPRAPSGADPLKALLATYDVHVPATVLGEVTEAAGSDDLLRTAADLVLQAAHHLTSHDVADGADERLDYGLDRGESDGIRLANELGGISSSGTSSTPPTTSSSRSHSRTEPRCSRRHRSSVRSRTTTSSPRRTSTSHSRTPSRRKTGTGSTSRSYGTLDSTGELPGRGDQ